MLTDRGVEHRDELGGYEQPQGDRAASTPEEAGQLVHGCGVCGGCTADSRGALSMLMITVACLTAWFTGRTTGAPPLGRW